MQLHYTGAETRLNNQSAPIEYIKQVLKSHLRLKRVNDGNKQCYSIKRAALDELPHAVGMLANEGYRLYWQSNVTTWGGLNHELYKFLERVASMGHPTPHLNVSVFLEALDYFIEVLHKAYSIPADDERDTFFAEALAYLVSKYPLYTAPVQVTVPPEMSPRLVIQ